MPEISRFFGIIIRMYYDDHEPPHFHAIYGEDEAQIGVDPIKLLEGKLPHRALSMALEWAALHQAELKENWKRVNSSQTANKIDPLK